MKERWRRKKKEDRTKVTIYIFFRFMRKYEAHGTWNLDYNFFATGA